MLVKPSQAARCLCEQVPISTPEGPMLAVRTLSVDCPVHSYPDDQWRSDSSLAKYAWAIDRETGEVMPPHEAWERYRAATADMEWAPAWSTRYRDERPSETEARLLAELRQDSEAGAP